jgi:hypothetical protein
MIIDTGHAQGKTHHAEGTLQIADMELKVSSLVQVALCGMLCSTRDVFPQVL